MKEYKAKSNDTQTFELRENDRFVGNLIYESWFSFKSSILLADNSRFQIEPKGFWETTIELKNNENTLLKFKMNWNGDIVIQSNIDNKEQDFLFKHKGTFNDSFVLINREGQELLAVKSDWKWDKFNYEYDIKTTDHFESFEYKDILLLTTIHCANYYMSMMTAVIAAT